MTTPRKPRISIFGLGKLGAPMVAVFGSKGFDVIGVDINEEAVDAINAGRSPVDEPQLQTFLERAGRRVRATLACAEAVHDSDISFIIVPTPSQQDGYFSNHHVITAIEDIGKALRCKQGYHLVVVTSTVMPGSVGGPIQTALEHSSGRRVGPKLGLCYAPEFIALGSVIHDMLNPDLVLIGESDERAGDLLEDVYTQSIDSDPEIHRMNFVNAELSKISINTFITTKISYANMLGEMCAALPGADADIVTRAMDADSRIGRKYLKPAIGYGGPCFPRDNKAFAALGHSLGVECALAAATDRINGHQIHRLTRAVAECAAPGEQVCILGLSYKPHTGVIDESQAVALAHRLSEAGYVISAFDPLANTVADLSNIMSVAATAAEVASPKSQTIIDPWGIVKARPGIQVIRTGTGDWRKSDGGRVPLQPSPVPSC
jgi:UDPglucose 6-dehydrogenase